MEDYCKELGLFLTNRRKEIGLSQKDIADALSVTSQAIYKYEHGLSYPDLSLVANYANILKVSVESFFKLENTYSNIENDSFDFNLFSANISNLRKNNNYTLTYLESILNVKYQTISKWERNESLPNIKQFIDLANLYNVSFTNLYYGKTNVVLKNKAEKRINKKLIISLSSLALCAIAIPLIILLTKNKPTNKNVDNSTIYSESIENNSDSYSESIISNNSIEEINVYTVTYDFGSFHENEQRNVKEGNKASFLNYEVEGYRLDHFTLNDNTFDFNSPIDSNITLKAIYIANTYRINLNANGGTCESSYLDVTYNELLTLPICEKQDYVFMGWSYNGVNLNNQFVYAYIDDMVTFDAIYSLVDDSFQCNETVDGIIIDKCFLEDNSDITIPSYINTKPVKKISKDAFNYENSIKHLTIPVTVEELEDGCFNGLDNIESITIPISINAPLIDLFEVDSGSQLPQTFKTIKFISDSNDFYLNTIVFSGNTNKYNIELGSCFSSMLTDGLDNILNIGNLTIPLSVNIFNNCAFRRCAKFDSLYYKGSLNDWLNCSFYDLNANPGLLANKIYMLDDDNNFYEIKGDIVIDEAITEIPENVFVGFKNVTSFALSSKTNEINSGAFYGCSGLEHFEIPSRITMLKKSVFEGCTSLKEIVLHENIISIDGSFSNSGLERVVIPETVSIVKERSFAECKHLESVIIYAKLDKIDHRMFYDCYNLKYIVLPETITYIGEQSSQTNGDFEKVFFMGNKEQWDNIEISTYNNHLLYEVPIYFYSESTPLEDGYFWKFDENNNIIVW